VLVTPPIINSFQAGPWLGRPMTRRFGPNAAACDSRTAADVLAVGRQASHLHSSRAVTRHVSSDAAPVLAVTQPGGAQGHAQHPRPPRPSRSTARASARRLAACAPPASPPRPGWRRPPDAVLRGGKHYERAAGPAARMSVHEDSTRPLSAPRSRPLFRAGNHCHVRVSRVTKNPLLLLKYGSDSPLPPMA